MAGMYQGGLLDTGGGGGGDLDNDDCDLVPTTWPSNAVQELSSVVGAGRRIVGGATELGVGSSGAGQFQKGDRPKSINKSPEKRNQNINRKPLPLQNNLKVHFRHHLKVIDTFESKYRISFFNGNKTKSEKKCGQTYAIYTCFRKSSYLVEAMQKKKYWQFACH